MKKWNQETQDNHDPLLKLCIFCKNSYFPGEQSYMGECRSHPPRSYLEGGKPGRFFPAVKFDDWCGQHRLIEDDVRVNGIFKKIQRLGSEEQRLVFADRIYQNDPSEAVEIYRAIHSSMSEDADISFRIGYGYFRRYRSSGNLSDGENAIRWLDEANSLNHADAPMTLGIMHANGYAVDVDIPQANEFLSIAADRGLQTAINKIAAGGFVERPPEAAEPPRRRFEIKKEFITGPINDPHR